MIRVSAVIPTHNRPELLREALVSLLNQSSPPSEIIVVDDGSQPPVDANALCATFGTKIRVLRNDQARGLSWARHQGVGESTGDVVIHLDDDDLLASDTIAKGAALFDEDPALEIIFLGTAAFGTRASHFNRVQPEGVDRVLAHGGASEVAPDVFQLQDNLIIALLRSVPQAFQHTMVRRDCWDRVTSLRVQAYGLEDPIFDSTRARERITGPLRDSEWALYAAALCRRALLLRKDCYLFRSDGQSYVSQPGNRERHLQQTLSIKRRFLDASRVLPELKKWENPICESLATDEFDAAFHYCGAGNRKKAWHHLKNAFKLRPKVVHAKFAIKLMMMRQQLPKVERGY